jgi:hypothetical protein
VSICVHLWLIVFVVRKLLISLAILVAVIAALLAALVFGGRQASMFIDGFGTIEMASVPIHSVSYEGSGTGGWLTVNDVLLSLNDTNPKIALSIGSTKDNQFALASGGKVFALGPLSSTAENGGDCLAVVPQAGNEALLVTRRSALSWPTPFEFSFMTGHSPSWKRHMYYELRWKKPSGATLDMLWRYEQPFYGRRLVPGDGWGNGFGVHEGSTGVIRVEIRP